MLRVTWIWRTTCYITNSILFSKSGSGKKPRLKLNQYAHHSEEVNTGSHESEEVNDFSQTFLLLSFWIPIPQGRLVCSSPNFNYQGNVWGVSEFKFHISALKKRHLKYCTKRKLFLIQKYESKIACNSMTCYQTDFSGFWGGQDIDTSCISALLGKIWGQHTQKEST